MSRAGAVRKRIPRKIATGWLGEQYMQNGSIVGTYSRDAFDRGWWAYGCLSDWEDTKLGLHATEAKARKAIRDWVRWQL